MIAAYAPPDVYAAENALMATLPEGELMARAVRGLARFVRERAHALGAQRVVALVGPGNNGGDALYAVARLASKGLTCGAVHLPGKVHEGAAAAAAEAGVELVTSAKKAAAHIADADIVLDGIVGIGGRLGLPEFAREWVAAIPESAHVVAVDLPSGQDPMGSAVDPDGIFADETVTFSVRKPLHLLPPTEAACGEVTVVDIGLTVEATPAVLRIEHGDVAELWPAPGAMDDKYSRGVLGVVAGGEHYTGAAVLCTTAAVEAGVGMVRYVGPPGAEAQVRSAVPEAVFGSGQVQAWVVGPGLDLSASGEAAEAQVEAARAALASELPVLVDAGGLDLIEPGERRAAPTLLTPHAGECATLLTRLGRPVDRAGVTAQPCRWARELASLTGATVLLKGATTLLISPNGPVFSQADAPAWLATAGSGDVLAGLAGALLAAGLSPGVAAPLAALVHGVAAHDANPGGPVRASAVACALPTTVARLLAG